MCFFYALSENAKSLMNRYQLKLDFEFELAPELREPKYYLSGFDFPRMPVISNTEPDRLQAMSWGLIPFWVKSKEQALEIRQNTLNARSETVFSKPSFRSVRRRRCIVPATGFYEWREFRGRKYPYFIHLKDQEVFSFAGIWDEWTDHNTGEILRTFTIMTTDANPLMATIHNTKKRMPVILPFETETNWLNTNLSDQDIMSFTQPFDQDLMAAHTISRLITSKTELRNVPAIQKGFEYPELEAL